VNRDYGIVVHGGAGSFTPTSKADIAQRKRILSRAASTGYELLNKGGSSVEAVEEAIKVLEDSAVFNAGSGASLTLEGKVTTDAAIMKGDLSCGCIGCVSISKNPISLARAVMERSDHVLMVGDESLSKFSRAIGLHLSRLQPSPRRLEQYKRNLATMQKGLVKAWPRNYKLLKDYLKNDSFQKTEPVSDTVGAVAVEKNSTVAAGVSTGGRWLKLPGRVGDSSVIGAGIYADDLAGAASATGAGEEIIRVCLSKSVCDLMRIGADAQTACETAVNILTARRGYGIAGVIAVDRFGRFGSARNTEMLQRSFRFKSMKRTLAVVMPKESPPAQRKISPNLTRLNF
jgi:L-asparaginase / beta-aspartyl-peptidase